MSAKTPLLSSPIDPKSYFPQGWDIGSVFIEKSQVGMDKKAPVGTFYLGGKDGEAKLVVLGLSQRAGITYGVYCGDREGRTVSTDVVPNDDGSPVIVDLKLSLIESPPSNRRMMAVVVVRDPVERKTRYGNVEVMLKLAADERAEIADAERQKEFHNHAHQCNRIDGQPQ